MFLIPYNRVTIRTALSPAELQGVFEGLLDGPPRWWALFPKETPGYRLRGDVKNQQVRLEVLPKPWHRTPYLPVARGSISAVDGTAILQLQFRPQLFEACFLAAWSIAVLTDGGPLLFGLGVPILYHVLGCLLGFGPEVERVVDLLDARIKDLATMESRPTTG